jgi:NAD(P)-dependent dehydrogenase (short-subunit alcohol dehydrogenase family)
VDLNGAVHLVTGASSGIGHGIARALAARDEAVVAVGRDVERLDALAEAAGPRVTIVTADLARSAGIEAVVAAVREPLVSVVHAAASQIPVTGWSELDPDELTDHFRVHVAAPIALTRAVAARARPGRMVIIDSYAATTPRVGWSAYAIMKAAAQMSARAAGQELDGTHVIRVFPGAVETPLLRTVLDSTADVPAVALYQGIEADGLVSDPLDIGREIAGIILDTTDDELDANESGEWHVGHAVAVSPRLPPSARR